jgi:hypothetical protein
MKRILYVWLAAALMAIPLGALAQTQSLGQAARQLRREKHPQATRVYTNDDIASARESSAAATPAAGEAAKPAAKEGGAEEAKGGPAITAGEVAKLNAEWQAKVTDQKKAISQLERELDVAQREYKLRTATYYADAGNALRDPKLWAEAARKYEAEIADKQKQLNEAKQKLEQIQEEARKAGAKVE